MLVNWPFKGFIPLSKHCWLYCQEALWSMILWTATADSWPQQHAQAQARRVLRSVRTRWLLYSWEAVLRAHDEYLWPAEGASGKRSYGLKITCLPDPPLLLGTVLSSGLREKSIWHSAMQSIFVTHFIMINEDVWMVCKCVWVWQGTSVPYWFILFSGAVWVLPGLFYGFSVFSQLSEVLCGIRWMVGRQSAAVRILRPEWG